VPEGTYLGWNLRKAGYGEGDLCLLAGSYVPFAADLSSRTGDPRPSLAERYPLAEDRATKMKTAAAQLRDSGFILDTDLEKVVR
jgi:Alpha/beta hydrolase domain